MKINMQLDILKDAGPIKETPKDVSWGHWWRQIMLWSITNPHLKCNTDYVNLTANKW